MEKQKAKSNGVTKFRGSHVSILGNKLKLNGLKPAGTVSTVLYETDFSKFTLLVDLKLYNVDPSESPTKIISVWLSIAWAIFFE